MRQKPLFIFLLFVATAALSPFRVYANDLAERQTRVRQQRLGQSSLRFNYSQPNYFLRKSTAKTKCVAIGQARCMGSRVNSQVQPNKFIPPNTTPNPLSPYLRGVYKYGIYKANSAFD